MKNDFDNAQTKALNQLWRHLPAWVQRVILWAVILGGICSAVWGAIKFVPDMIEWFKSPQADRSDEAAKVIEKAKQDIRQEHDKMLQAAKAELSSVVLLATERVLKEKLTAAADHTLVARSLAELK